MGDLALFIPFLALFGVIIYMQTRQRKKLQDRQATLQSALGVGTPIMLSCGLHGDVTSLDETTVDVEIAPGVVATFARAAVLEVRGTESTFVDDDEIEDLADGNDIAVVNEERSAEDVKRGTETARPAKPLAHDDPST
ncbi:MAG: preprotein translocase subunit YajC [Actinomycetota bacterium]|nr:preprotein translocase subunit YajC [Geodermatophilaceae bacterium]MDQ3505482.1 preprotein translocase subunit YajC [Actinomycetota bacterium]